MSELKTFSVFPGQVVGVEGRNPGGRKMVAGKVCEGVMKPLEKTSAGEMLELQHGSGAQDGKVRKLTKGGRASERTPAPPPERGERTTAPGAQSDRNRISPPLLEPQNPSQPLSVIAAAGPFTTNQNFDFEPMSDLLHVVSR